jgi:hypothetical protein
MFSRSIFTIIISLNNINQLVFVMKTGSIFFDVGTEYLGAFGTLRSAYYVRLVCLSVCPPLCAHETMRKSLEFDIG